MEGAEGGERGGSSLYRLSHDSGVPHIAQDRRVGGGLLHSGGDSERAGERGLPCRGWQTGCGEDAPHRLRPHSSWLHGTGQQGGECLPGRKETEVTLSAISLPDEC